MSTDFTAAQWYGMADDSVNLINGVNAGTWTLNDFATLTQAEKNNMMQRNIDVLNSNITTRSSNRGFRK
jgi:hypothetical protein